MMDPRLDPDEIEFFKKLLETKAPGTKMVEWGSGGSTILFLPYFTTGQLISVEHNREWVDKVTEEVKTNKSLHGDALENFTYCWRPPHFRGNQVQLSFHGYGIPYEECPTFCADYINPEDVGLKVFDADIYFVDGVCRGAVLATIHAKATNRNARVFLHDHHGSEHRQEWYNWSTRLYRKVEEVGSTLAELTL